MTQETTTTPPDVASVTPLPPGSCGKVESFDALNFRVCACLVWDIEGADSKDHAFNTAHQRLQQILKQAGLLDKVETRLQINPLKPPRHNPRVAIYNPDDILQFVTAENSQREFVVDGKSYAVSMASSRYQLFIKNRSCCACGIVGTKMILELHQGGERGPEGKSQKAHFNLYAEENGRLVLMTKDHIKSRARGGPNHMDNYQPMCMICNNLKGSADFTPEEVAELRRIYNQYRTTLSSPMLHAKLRKEKRRLVVLREQAAIAIKGEMQKSEADRLAQHDVIVNICELAIWHAGDRYFIKPTSEAVTPECVRVGTIPAGVEFQPKGVLKRRVFINWNNEDLPVFYGYFQPKSLLSENRLESA